jgi:hypothetical protein
MAELPEFIGKDNVIFHKPVWLYRADRFYTEPAVYEWFRALTRPPHGFPNIMRLWFHVNWTKYRLEALQDIGTLAGWPYFRRVGWLSMSCLGPL